MGIKTGQAKFPYPWCWCATGSDRDPLDATSSERDVVTDVENFRQMWVWPLCYLSLSRPTGQACCVDQSPLPSSEVHKSVYFARSTWVGERPGGFDGAVTGWGNCDLWLIPTSQHHQIPLSRRYTSREEFRRLVRTVALITWGTEHPLMCYTPISCLLHQIYSLVFTAWMNLSDEDVTDINWLHWC